jgi:hypothetical protein
MTPAGAPPTVFVIDDEDDMLASALAKLAESVGPLGPPMHPPTAAIPWLRSFLDGAGKRPTAGGVGAGFKARDRSGAVTTSLRPF